MSLPEINLELYAERLSLLNAKFERIDHPDAMVADVYRVSVLNKKDKILKVLTRKGDFLREVYFFIKIL
jgi:hypothetical protein